MVRPNPWIIIEAPIRIDTCVPSGQSPPNKLDPQIEQNAFTAPSALAVNLNQFLALKQTELLAPLRA